MSIVKQVSVQITRIDDIELGEISRLDEALTVTDEVCVFSSGVPYAVGVSSAGGAFALTGAESGHELPYAVSWAGELLTPPPRVIPPALGGLVDPVVDRLGTLLSALQPGTDFRLRRRRQHRVLDHHRRAGLQRRPTGHLHRHAHAVGRPGMTRRPSRFSCTGARTPRHSSVNGGPETAPAACAAARAVR